MSEDGKFAFQTADITNKTYELGSNFLYVSFMINYIHNLKC